MEEIERDAAAGECREGEGKEEYREKEIKHSGQSIISARIFKKITARTLSTFFFTFYQ